MLPYYFPGKTFKLGICLPDMRLFVFTCLFVTQGYFAVSQEAPDSQFLETDTLLQQSTPVWSVFLNPYLQWNEVFKRPMPYAGADAELRFKERIIVGVNGEMMLGTFVKRVVFPNPYELTNHKYGLTLGYNHPIGERLNLTGRLKMSQQYVRWQEVEGERYTLADYSYELRPQVSISYKIIENIHFGGTLGHNFSNGLDMSGIGRRDMNGWIYSINLNFRIWKK